MNEINLPKTPIETVISAYYLHTEILRQMDVYTVHAFIDTLNDRNESLIISFIKNWRIDANQEYTT